MNTKNLNKFLFQDSQKQEAQAEVVHDIARLMEDAFNLSKFEEKRPALLKVLKELKIEDADGRLDVVPSGFSLISNCEIEHGRDRDALLDIEKSNLITDAGFVAIPGESDKDDEGAMIYSVLLVPVDCACEDDLEDKLEKIDIDKYLSAANDELNGEVKDAHPGETAEELVKRLLSDKE